MLQRHRNMLVVLMTCAALGCGMTPAVAGESQEPRGGDKSAEAGTDARLLADLDVLRDLELLRQLDVLRKVEEVRAAPRPRGPREEKEKP